MEELKTIYFLFITAEIVNVAIIRRMMCCFFHVPEKIKPNECTGYFLYYFFHLTAHLLKISMIPYLVGQTILLWAITFFYSSDLKSKVFASAYISAAVLFSDAVFQLLYGCSSQGFFAEDIGCCVWSCLASKLALLALIRFFAMRNNIDYFFRQTPLWCLLMTAAIPAASLYVLHVLADSSEKMTEYAALCVITLNGIALIFYFHTASYNKKDCCRKSVEKTVPIPENIRAASSCTDDLRIFRHDMINHFTVLEYHLENGNVKKSRDYLQKMMQLCGNQTDIRTGNPTADSILGRKIMEARQKEIDVYCDISAVGELSVPDFDLTCIFGNLLDNAIEASQKSPEKIIRIVLKRSGDLLIFRVKNTFQGNIIRKNGFLLTTKQDSGKHGIGLHSVDRTVRELNGSLDLHQEGEYFCAMVKIYTK